MTRDEKKERKKKHKSRAREEADVARLLGNPSKLVAKLLKWSRKNKANKLDNIFKECPNAVNLTAMKDSQGRSLLHQACQAGSDEAVEVLLKYGADTSAGDHASNTPAHLAASGGHLIALTKVLQSKNPPDVELRNAQGISIQELVMRALGQDTTQHTTQRTSRDTHGAHPSTRPGGKRKARALGSDSDAYSTEWSDSVGCDSHDSHDFKKRKAQRGHYSDDGHGRHGRRQDSETDEEERWRRKLADEGQYEDGFGGFQYRGDDDDGNGAGAAFGGDSFGVEDDDAWADRMWQEMQSKRRAAARAATSAFSSSFKDAAASRAAEESARREQLLHRLTAAGETLRQEQDKDARWRARALQGPSAFSAPVPQLIPEQAWKAYNTAWESLEQRLKQLQLASSVSNNTRHQTHANTQDAKHHSHDTKMRKAVAMESETGFIGPPEAHGRVASGTDGNTVKERTHAVILTFDDMAWPLPPGHEYSVDNLRDVLLFGVQGPGDIKKRLRGELMRWHPDKFSARFVANLSTEDMTRAMARVKEISQALTGMMTG